MSRGDREHWDLLHAGAPGEPPAPAASFLMEHADLLSPGRTLDLACGRGRNAAFLHNRGHRVIAVDASRAALQEVRLRGRKITVVQMDLDQFGFREGSLDSVVCINFLDRRLLDPIRSWLRPGGRLLLDTFLIDQKELGHPRNPQFLLGHNELLRRLDGFRVLRYREGLVFEGDSRSFRAGVVAERC